MNMITPPPEPNYKVGIYGWRKRCLYLLVLILMLLIVVNLALTVWVFRVLDFSMDGMGKIRITNKGLKLSGDAHFKEHLFVEKIVGSDVVPLSLEGEKVRMRAYSKDANRSSYFQLGADQMTAVTDRFAVRSSRGKELFSVDESAVKLGVDSLEITGDGGVTFGGALQTAQVRSRVGDNLALRSPTRALHIDGAAGVQLRASPGDVDVRAVGPLTVTAEHGPVTIDGANLRVPNLPLARAASDNHVAGVYQLCVCPNGRLFLSSERCRAAPERCDLS